MIKKRFISMLVLLMTAVSGAWAQEETLLTTITPTGDGTYSETTAGAVTVTPAGSFFYSGSSYYGWQWDYYGSLTVAANEGYTITRCVFIQQGNKSVTISEAPFALNFEEFLCLENYSMSGVSSIEVYGTAPAAPAANPEYINLTPNTDGTVWTLAEMPDFDVELEVEYYDEVTLTDGNAITGLNDYKEQEIWVNYTRSFTKWKISTVCLPFAYEKKEGDGSFYGFTNIEKEGSEYVATMTETSSTTLEASTPYVYLPNATGDVDFGGAYTIPAELTAGSTTSNGWTFKGTFETIEWETAPTGTYGFAAQDQDGIYQGQFVKVGSYVRIKPMRCYLENDRFAGARGANRAAEQLPDTIKVRLVGADGEVTGIGTISTKTGEGTIDNGAWYSLDGRRIEGKPSTKGIYINNGNKVVIK